MSIIYCQEKQQPIDLDKNSEHQLYCVSCGNIDVYEDYLKDNWVAIRGDYDLGDPIGRGSSKEEAIDDLVSEEDYREYKRSKKNGRT
jgi:hypothetical protein